MSETALPKSWVKTSLGNVIEFGKTEKATPADVEEDTWVLELEDIEKSSSTLLQRYFYSERKFKSAKNKFKNGSILYGKLRPYLNKVIIADRDGVCTTEILPLDGGLFLNNKFLFYWLKSAEFISYVTTVAYGVNMPRLGTKDGHAAPFVLSPFAEQKEIVIKLDKLLAQVDSIKTRLDAIPSILKRFRQSILAAAVSGKLTEEWRGNAEYIDEYPIHWTKQKLFQLGELARGKSKHRPRNDPLLFGCEYPFIQTGEVTNSGGRIKGACNFYSEFGLKQSRLFPRGSLCITIAANIADTTILDIPVCFPDSIVGFIPQKDKCVVEFVKYLIDVNKANLEKFAPATAQKNINLKVLNELLLPIPSLEEQSEIVRRVEQLFFQANRIEQQVKNAKARVNHLTQSILAKAFSGELTADWRDRNPDLISGEFSAGAVLKRIVSEKRAKNKRSTK